MARKTRKELEIEKLIKLGYSESEALELFEFDHSDAIESDENLKNFLKDELLTSYIEEKEIEEMFYKPAPKGKAKLTPAGTKENKVKSEKTNEERILALAEGLAQYDFLFSKEILVDGLTLTFTDSETDLPVSIKITKHKTQKVVAKEIKRKDPLAPFSTIELRQMAIQNVMLANKKLFEAPSFAGSQFGFAARDLKFPFGSVKLTHHKK